MKHILPILAVAVGFGFSGAAYAQMSSGQEVEQPTVTSSTYSCVHAPWHAPLATVSPYRTYVQAGGGIGAPAGSANPDNFK